MMRLAPTLAAAALAFACAMPVQAQPSGDAADGFIVDPASGCGTSNPFPRPKESIRWTGGCRDGRLDGAGVLVWYEDGVEYERDVGTFTDGELDGPAVVSFAGGNTIYGRYENGVRDGAFTVVTPDGRYVRALYQNGAFVTERELSGEEIEAFRSTRAEAFAAAPAAAAAAPPAPPDLAAGGAPVAERATPVRPEPQAAPPVAPAAAAAPATDPAPATALSPPLRVRSASPFAAAATPLPAAPASAAPAAPPLPAARSAPPPPPVTAPVAVRPPPPAPPPLPPRPVAQPPARVAPPPTSFQPPTPVPPPLPLQPPGALAQRPPAPAQPAPAEARTYRLPTPARAPAEQYPLGAIPIDNASGISGAVELLPGTPPPGLFAPLPAAPPATGYPLTGGTVVIDSGGVRAGDASPQPFAGVVPGTRPYVYDLPRFMPPATPPAPAVAAGPAAPPPPAQDLYAPARPLPGREPPPDAPAAVAAPAPVDDAPPLPPPGRRFSVSLVDVPIATAANAVFGTMLKLPYEIDDGVSGRVTIAPDRPVEARELVAALRLQLQASGADLRGTGDGYRIVRAGGG